jgi:hypothetical protein
MEPEAALDQPGHRSVFGTPGVHDWVVAYAAPIEEAAIRAVLVKGYYIIPRNLRVSCRGVYCERCGKAYERAGGQRCEPTKAPTPFVLRNPPPAPTPFRKSTHPVDHGNCLRWHGPDCGCWEQWKRPKAKPSQPRPKRRTQLSSEPSTSKGTKEPQARKNRRQDPEQEQLSTYRARPGVSLSVVCRNRKVSRAYACRTAQRQTSRISYRRR